MPHGHTRFATKSACIYCGAAGTQLTDEHIVPLSLGGQHIIDKASCGACADITKRFEQDVARGLWGDARISYDAPSRRKNLRSKQIALRDPHGKADAIVIPYSEYPAPMVFYQMEKAGILQGLAETHDISRHWTLVAITDQKKLEIFLESYPGRLVGKFRHVPSSFGRMIAKIGYGQVMSVLDPGGFNPICLPYILGQKQNVSFVVGSGDCSEKPEADLGYKLGTTLIGCADYAVIIAEVRLIANNCTPRYHVVVGDVSGQRKVESVVTKLGKGTTFPLMHKWPDEEAPAWLPDSWPLPWQTPSA